jgi:NAD(P)-dependent dehydrogenase (short-subunit alcohol dehydrogenase family)
MGLGSLAPRGRSVRTVRELADLSGRTALVIGGAGHLGRVACEALAELGAQVASADLVADVASTATRTFEVDLHDEDATRALVPAFLKEFGRMDVLVHCAAYTGANEAAGWATEFDQQTVLAWDRAHRVNTTSAFVLAQAARSALGSHGTGSVVLVSSIYATLAPDFRIYAGTNMQSPAGYSVSKAGLLQLMRYLSILLAPDVRVNAVSPGGVLRDQPLEFVRRYERGTPLARMAIEEDIAGAIAYLASDLSSYVTGVDLRVDGGRSVW